MAKKSSRIIEFKQKLLDKVADITNSYDLQLVKGAGEYTYVQQKDSFVTLVSLAFGFYDETDLFTVNININWDIFDSEQWHFEQTNICLTDGANIEKMLSSIDQLLGTKYHKT
ncbi:hypothetical protein FD723_18495 [Nostoc sp. C052]|uniref:hypothetical protein n=1 Tax=Nostoc sp. C052 TaxID=2576902 RepID=UPI0015C3F3B7|nr:hypothetical protein [Nostoc sp. C052]QLE42210.1 hypothetical protein FD723_18495 [Nostoc sp. C052]